MWVELLLTGGTIISTHFRKNLSDYRSCATRLYSQFLLLFMLCRFFIKSHGMTILNFNSSRDCIKKNVLGVMSLVVVRKGDRRENCCHQNDSKTNCFESGAFPLESNHSELLLWLMY